LNTGLPGTQYAVELTGPGKFALNRRKPVPVPGPYQILARVDAVGLCFSDLKLLKHFDKHPRKGPVISGIDCSILSEIASYKPGQAPTVPGHEAVCTIVAIGEKVKRHKPNQRVALQTDYRWLKTVKSNASFGYNFEGALQQYTLLDERIIIDPRSDESFLLPVESNLSSSAIAMVEPWACVESSYATSQRRTILENSNLLIVAGKGRQIQGLAESFSHDAKPASVTVVCADDSQLEAAKALGIKQVRLSVLEKLADESFDDIVYFGSSKQVIEVLDDKLAAGGIINIVLGGLRIGSRVSIGLGRVHYGPTRWIGTTGADSAQSYKNIPRTGELRDRDKALVIGAGGPMGQMHTIRMISSGRADLSVTAADVDTRRLELLEQRTRILADRRAVELSFVNPSENPLRGEYSYTVVMAPVGRLIDQAIASSLPKALINVFAGIPAGVKEDIDLDTYIEKQCYMFGASGSRLEDVKTILYQLESGRLNTDYSVAAVSGMAGAIEGIRAVKNRRIAGKIIVYPSLTKMPLVALSDMRQIYPAVAEKITNGLWNVQAEKELIKAAGD